MMLDGETVSEEKNRFWEIEKSFGKTS